MPVLSRPLSARRSGSAASGRPHSRAVPQTDRRAGPSSGPERPRPVPSTASTPASRPSPTDPVLRANPCPEVTDPFCRLPLPTLFYRLEAVHLGDLMRIRVRTDARTVCPHPDFQGPTATHGTTRKPRRSTGAHAGVSPTFLVANSFHGRAP